MNKNIENNLGQYKLIFKCRKLFNCRTIFLLIIVFAICLVVFSLRKHHYEEIKKESKSRRQQHPISTTKPQLQQQSKPPQFKKEVHQKPNNSYSGRHLTKKYDNKNYITLDLTTSIDGCGGLGNMMWRIASLYSIGKYLNRTVFFERPEKCFHEYKQEFEDIFEDFGDKIKFMNPTEEEIKIVHYAEDCCRFDHPARLIDEEAQIIKIHGNYFQSFKYFKLNNTDLDNFFKFQKSIIKKAKYFAQKIDLNVTQFKFCVHTRRDDFVEYYQSSQLRFTNRAIAFVLRNLKKRFDDISIVLLGNDKNFLNHIDIDEKIKVYMPGIRNRGVDLFFSKTYCNALLITAPTSTYSWWIGYLMLERSPIYYYNCNLGCRHITKFDYFPPSWLPLEINFAGEIEIDDNPL